MRRSSWHLRTGAVVAAWLVAAVTVGVVALARPVTPWLLVHLLLLGAVSNAILIWSTHFAAALLRLPGPGDRSGEATRLAVFNAGALTVVVAMAVDSPVAVVIGAVAVGAAVAGHAIVLMLRMHRTPTVPVRDHRALLRCSRRTAPVRGNPRGDHGSR